MGVSWGGEQSITEHVLKINFEKIMDISVRRHVYPPTILNKPQNVAYLIIHLRDRDGRNEIR